MTADPNLIEAVARAILPMWFDEPCGLENYPGQAERYRADARKWATAALAAINASGEWWVAPVSPTSEMEAAYWAGSFAEDWARMRTAYLAKTEETAK